MSTPDDNYVYILVKLNLHPGQTEDSVQEVVSEMDYSFSHEQILNTEIMDIHDMQVDDPWSEDLAYESTNNAMDLLSESMNPVGGES